MKKKIFSLFFFVSFFIFCQSKETQVISFALIEETPMYETCKDFESNSARKKCVNSILTKHIQDNYDLDLINCLEEETVYGRKNNNKTKCVQVLLPGEKRIYLDFNINEIGEIEEIAARAPHYKLKEEAIRVALLIPKMIPGKHNSKPVKVSYTLPIDLIVK